jgi:hypothetical protein
VNNEKIAGELVKIAHELTAGRKIVDGVSGSWVALQVTTYPASSQGKTLLWIDTLRSAYLNGEQIDELIGELKKARRQVD